jgi:hypothetical protein
MWSLAKCTDVAPAQGYTESDHRPSVALVRIPTAPTAGVRCRVKDLQNTKFSSADKRAIPVVAVGIHPLRVDHAQ